MLSAIAQAIQIDTNSAILRDLDPQSGSSKLEELMLDFDDILRDGQRAQELRVFSFQEEEGMASVRILGGKVSPTWIVSIKIVPIKRFNALYLMSEKHEISSPKKCSYPPSTLSLVSTA